MTHELRDNGDLVISDEQGRPLAKLQAGLSWGNAFLTVRAGEHPLDTYAGTLRAEDVEALREWCERELTEHG